MLLSMVAPPVLLLVLVIPVASRLQSVRVIGYKARVKMCALDEASETISPSSEKDCSLKCSLSALCAGFNIKNSLIHLPVMASIHPCWLQPEELRHV